MLVTVMHANNEVGTIQPIQEIAADVALRAGGAGRRSILHSDGVQAFGKVPVRVRELGVDLYSISAHKVYAPKGTGCFIRPQRVLRSHRLWWAARHEGGGGQVRRTWSGAMAFAKAVELLDRSAPYTYAALRD